ncbi:unnamed protein product [Prunus brigantina]
MKDLLVDIDKNVTIKVEMGTGQLVEVTGKREPCHKMEIYDDSSYSNMVARVQMRGNRSFPMKLQPGIHIAYRASVCQSTTLWHRRLGHLNMSSLRLLQEQDMVAGLPKIKAVKGVCEGCVLSKQCREAFPREATTGASTPLELIHSDVCGLMQTTTKAGNRYFLTFIDDYTRIQLTTPYTPQQNGVAERKNRTIVEMAKCMMLEKKIPFEFWAEAVNTSVYVLNRCPTKALLKKTPFEAYRYGSCEKGYRLYNIETGKVIISRDVVFNEDACWDWNTQEEKKQGHEGSSCDSMAQGEESEVFSSSTEIYDQERMTGPQDIDHTLLKYKSLAEVYEKCNLCIIEPENFEEAAKDDTWRKAMED